MTRVTWGRVPWCRPQDSEGVTRGPKPVGYRGLGDAVIWHYRPVLSPVELKLVGIVGPLRALPHACPGKEGSASL